MTVESKESALKRWSRRKAESQVEDALEREAGPALDADATTPVETDAPPLLTDADMPAIETLDEDSDYSGFMSEGVSEELRQLALRKLFRSSVFNIRDGLDEYDEDYTSFEKLGDIVTSDMKHRIEMEQQKLREKLAAEAELAEEEQAGIDAAEEDEIEDDIEADLDDDNLAVIEQQESSPVSGDAADTAAKHSVNKNE